MSRIYDCIIIGGGIAGLQAAIQLGRYQDHVAVIDSNNGRSTLCRNYHNILGWPNGVSGETLRNLGRSQAESYHISFFDDTVYEIKKEHDVFEVSCQLTETKKTKRILLATGVMDRIPEIKNIKPTLGITIYVCPDCDGYEIMNKDVIVLGSGMTGVNMAFTLTQWSDSIIYINHDGEEIDEKTKGNLSEKGIHYMKEQIDKVLTTEANPSHMVGVQLQNGEIIHGERGFIGFGRNEVRTNLVEQLGVERLENKHIVVNPRTKETNIPNVWAAGDIAVHSEQVTIAMGDGMQAAIWIHKSILEDKSRKIN